MTLIKFIEPTGTMVEADASDGWSVMQVAMAEGVAGIDAECGGSLACATCHCYVLSVDGPLPPPTATELLMLASVAAERRDNSRLSCQIKATADLAGITIRFPEFQS